TFQNNKKLFCDHTDLFFNGQPGTSKVVVHPLVSTTGMKQLDFVSLREQVFETIKSELPDDY
ncbi:MAG: 1-acyl-sn-glycerol-3-phosphate acyltransferase, partial [Flavobacteriales bacterium]|nr:1-acyl-sn-glycerol-3-phosphate acyltransferase [Flavobacteriales bacterium]